MWSDLVAHWQEPGFDDSVFLSVADVQRTTFDVHPWSLGGGGAAELKELLESRAERRLGDVVELIGFGAVTREDDVFTLPKGAGPRFGIPPSQVLTYGYGEAIRDRSINSDQDVIFPYTREGTAPSEALGRYYRVLWNYRTQLWERQGKGFKTKRDAGGEFYECSMFYPERHFTGMRITFAFVATHNHFVLDRGGKVFNRSAPIIKLPWGATEEDHLALLAYLNSSTACFWMKQVCHNKTNASQKHTTDPARAAYEFAGTALLELPVPAIDADATLVKFAKALLDVALARGACLRGALLDSPGSWTSSDVLRDALAQSWVNYDAATRRAAYLQEELDWAVYRLFGLAEQEPQPIPLEGEASLGSRPFEHVAGYDPGITARVARVHETPSGTMVVPSHWEHRRASTPMRDILESRAFKRAWRETESNVDQVDYRVRAAIEWVESGVLERLEEASRSRAETWTSARAASDISAIVEVAAAVLSADARALVEQLIDGNAIPYLASLRYSDGYSDIGLDKRAQWEATWDLQRREDAGETLSIPVPPKYDVKDFRDANFFRLRGKLDVPKERFISYPGTEKDDDPSPLYGWAGWDPGLPHQKLDHFDHMEAGAKIVVARCSPA